MEFRWTALIALWTMISGPVFGPPVRRPAAAVRPHAAHPSHAQGKERANRPARSLSPRWFAIR